LILRDINSGEAILDSFSYPTDAAVPSMRISANRVTGKKISFVSKKSENDPSSQNFQLVLKDWMHRKFLFGIIKIFIGELVHGMEWFFLDRLE
jgi:hypothetical protein